MGGVRNCQDHLRQDEIWIIWTVQLSWFLDHSADQNGTVLPTDQVWWHVDYDLDVAAEVSFHDV